MIVCQTLKAMFAFIEPGVIILDECRCPGTPVGLFPPFADITKTLSPSIWWACVCLRRLPQAFSSRHLTFKKSTKEREKAKECENKRVREQENKRERKREEKFYCYQIEIWPLPKKFHFCFALRDKKDRFFSLLSSSCLVAQPCLLGRP